MTARDNEYSSALLSQAWDYPLGQAIAGRRSRRFGLGMELPGGPMAFKSRHDPFPLSETEQTLLICAATGVTGWNFGIPYTTGTPDSHASYAMRLHRARSAHRRRRRHTRALLHRRQRHLHGQDP